MTALTFHDRMDGFVSFAETDFNQAWLEGRRSRRGCSFNINIEIDDVNRFLDDPRHLARVRGKIVCEELGGELPISDGTFNLFVDVASDPREARMRYRLHARDVDGREITLSGFKDVADAPGFDVWSDTSTLFIRLLSGRVTDADEEDREALADRTIATGILRISALGFGRLLASVRVSGGTAWQRIRARQRFATEFASKLWRVYGGPTASDDLGDFPDPTDPRAIRWDGHPPGEWHQSFQLPGLWRRIVPLQAGDGHLLTLHNVRASPQNTGRTPVLLIHGTGVRANLFYGAPGRPSLVRTLVDAGFDVWLENWRGSIDLDPVPYTLDEAARYDHPAAIESVLADTGAEKLRVLCHCQGSTSFVITALAGLAPQVERVVSSAVSLHPVVPRWSRVKLWAMVPLIGMGSPYLSAQWSARPPHPPAQAVAWWAQLWRRECDDPVCALSNYMYGFGPDVLWRHANLDPQTHHWTSREFGYAPIRFLKQIRRSVLAGHLVPVDRLPDLPESYVSAPPRIDAPWTFVAGSRNRLFTAESQVRTHAWFERFEPGRHGLQVFDGYGHLDLLFGRDAGREVHPHLVAALGAPA